MKNRIRNLISENKLQQMNSLLKLVQDKISIPNQIIQQIFNKNIIVNLEQTFRFSLREKET